MFTMDNLSVGETVKPGQKRQKVKKENEFIEQPSAAAKKTMTRHAIRRATSEYNLFEVLEPHFENGYAYHVISQGDIDSLSYLKHIIKQQKIKYLILSTWCMGREDVNDLLSWYEKGLIKRFDLYVGEIFKSRYSNEFILLRDFCKKHSECRVAMFRNHSKVMCVFGESFDAVIESSANVNTNPRCEQTTITCDRDLALFYKNFYDGIKSVDNSFDNWEKLEDV